MELFTSIVTSFSMNPFMPGGTKMYRQRAKNSNFSNFGDIFSFGRQMGLCAKNLKNPPSSLFLGINGLMWDWFYQKHLYHLLVWLLDYNISDRDGMKTVQKNRIVRIFKFCFVQKMKSLRALQKLRGMYYY